MGFLSRLRDAIAGAVKTFSSHASSVLKSVKTSGSPLSDRLLSDALRLAEIPSPTPNEEQRAAFVVERLTALGIPSSVDGQGNITARLTCSDPVESSPILLFTHLSSPQWHPVESLSRLGPEKAFGAGLGDALGPATLLSVAEAMLTGGISTNKDILLLFAARPLDDPGCDIFRRLCDDPMYRPLAALGIKGIQLGTIQARTMGTYRIEVRVRTDADIHDTDTVPGSAVDAVVAIARTLSGVTWDAEKKTSCQIRRLEAGTAFGHIPTEGIIDIEMESSDSAVLEMAMKAALATAESTGKDAKAKVEASIVGFVQIGRASCRERV